MSKLDELLHSYGGVHLAHIYDPAEYNPQQAHLYYEQHKKLKGRRPAAAKITKGRSSRSHAIISKHRGATVHKPTKTAAQRRREVQAKVSSLKAKLARLSQVLEKLVKEAKARGIADPADAPADSKKKDTTPSSTKAESKLTPQEKQKARDASKKYREAHQDPPEVQAQQLQDKIDAISEKIKEKRAQIAAADAAKGKRTSSSVGARAKPNK